MKLNPNCSEIVVRLNGEQIEVWTDSFPNACLGNMIGIMKSNPKKPKLEFVENSGGGGNFDFVEACYELAKKVVKGKMPEDLAVINESRIWHGLEVIEKCCGCDTKKNLLDAKECNQCHKAFCSKCAKKMINTNKKSFCSEKCKNEGMVDEI